MNPYGIAQPAAVNRATFAEFNAGVSRAADEYAAHPIASCAYRDCYELLEFGERVCPTHFDLLALARNQMRALRARRSA